MVDRTGSGEGRAGKVLVVEDEADVAEMIRYNLGREGYEVRLAATGTDALRQVKEVRPDLILLDIMVPHLNGWEICRRLRQDRETQVTRIGFVAELLTRHGVIVLVPVIAPYADAREKVRAHHAEHGSTLLQVHLSTPVEVCAERDVKGLYAKAFRGEIRSMTGVDDPYEIPEYPDLRIDTSALVRDASVAALLDLLTERGLV